MNVLLISDLHGRLIAASKAYPGGRHDKRSLDEAGWETSLGVALNWKKTSGFAGTGGIRRTKKRPGQTKAIAAAPNYAASTPTSKPWSDSKS